MSHPDSLYDPDNSYDDDIVNNEDDANYDDDNDFNESMDGDHDSAMTSCGWGTDEDYGSYGDDIDAFHDYYGEDF
jgi:hypothetical protein